MSIPALLTLLAAAVLLARTLTRFDKTRPVDQWIRVTAAAAAVYQFRSDGILLSMMSVYVLVTAALGSDLIAWFRRRSRTPDTGEWREHRSEQTAAVGRGRRGRFWLRLAFGLLSLPLFAVPVIEATVIPLDVDNLRDKTWSDAFAQLHGTLQSHYAFGDWKHVDWDGIYARHAVAVTTAESDDDPMAYYRAIRSYLFELPDGHINADGPAYEAARSAEIGGGFGFAIVRVDDGTAITHVVTPGGPAADAGMVFGAQVIALDNLPTAKAAAATAILWASRPPATAVVASIAQYQLVTRAPIGTELTVTFQNPEAARPRTVVLTAEDDDFASLDAGRQTVGRDDGVPVQAELLDGNIGYVRISSLQSSADGTGVVELFDQALRTVDDAAALILDTRGNRGGRDDLVPPIMSHFASERILYEHIAVRSPLGDGTIRLFSLHVEPGEFYDRRPVVVLVDHRTKSSGEGFALIAKQLPQVTVIGHEATDGSFGIVGGSVLLPTGIEVQYPWAQSLDRDGNVQVDGDHQRRGGVEPDITVPFTVEAVEAIHLRGEDVALQYAVDWLRARR